MSTQFLRRTIAFQHMWQLAKVLKPQRGGYVYCPYLPTPSARAGYDTGSIFKRSLTVLNSEFSFS